MDLGTLRSPWPVSSALRVNYMCAGAVATVGLNYLTGSVADLP